MPDPTPWAFWTLLFSAILLAMAGAAITWANRGSETIVLGFTALIGALALFAGQLFFQLRPTIREEPIAGAQILVDHTDRVIVAFQATNMIRAVVERDAAKWLISNSETAFDGEDGKPVRDLLILSILNYIAMMQPDWRMRVSEYHFPAMGNSPMIFFEGQRPEESHTLREDDIRQSLRAAGNVFAAAPLTVPSSGIRIPPGSRMRVHAPPDAPNQTVLVISNPVLQLEFIITPVMSAMRMRPPKPGEGIPLGGRALNGMPDHEYSMHYLKVLLKMAFSRAHAHRPDINEYRAWCDRLTAGTRDWFKTTA